MILAVSALVLVHGDVEYPMQAVFDAPMMTDNVIETFGGKRRAKKIIRCFCCGFSVHFADTRDLADSGEPRPLMTLLKPSDIS